MKMFAVVGAGVVIALAAGGLYWQTRPEAPAGAVPHPAGRDAALMVDDLRDNPDRFQGETQVLGVVGGASAARQLFGLIDRREVEACGQLDCPEFILPVKWGGEAPTVGETVSVRGTVKKTDEGLVFVASEVNRP